MIGVEEEVAVEVEEVAETNGVSILLHPAGEGLEEVAVAAEVGHCSPEGVAFGAGWMFECRRVMAIDNRRHWDRVYQMWNCGGNRTAGERKRAPVEELKRARKYYNENRALRPD